MTASQEIHYYELIAQNRNGELILRLIGSETLIVKTATEIIQDPYLYNRLSSNDIDIIKFISQTV